MADDHCSQQSQTLSPERPILVSPLNSSLLSEGRRAMAPSSAPHEGVPVGQELKSEEIKDALISFLPSFSNLMISIQHYSEDTISAQWKKKNYAEENQESWIRVLANFLCSFKAIERIIYRLDNVEKNKELLRRSFRSELRIRAVWIAFRVSCVLVDFMVYMRGKEHLIEELKRKLNRTVKENPTSSRVAKRFLSIIKLSEKVLSTMKIDSVAVKTEELDRMGSMLIETVKDLDDVISWKQERIRMDVKLISSLHNLMQLTKRLHKHHKALEAIVDEVWKDYYDFFNKKLDGEDEYEADSDLAEELQIPCNTVTVESSICCSNCGRCLPKDKTIRRFIVRSVVEQAVEVQYCISCAIHSHLMRIRSRNDSRKHEPPQRMGDQAPPPAGVAAPGQAPPAAACV